jgi:hypothetical protein
MMGRPASEQMDLLNSTGFKLAAGAAMHLPLCLV